MKKSFLMLVTVLLLCLVFGADAEGVIPITLAPEGIQTGSESVQTEGQIVKITQPGEYLLSGSLENGQIQIDCQEKGKVTLYANGVSIHNETGPAILIGKCSPRAEISLVSGTENKFSNGNQLVFDEGYEPDGVIFTRSDLTISGGGMMEISAGAMNGMSSKDDLRIEGGTITVNAPNHGMKGKDSIEISGGKIIIRAGKDGIKSTNKTDPSRGYIEMTDGEVSISCGDDAISFVTFCNISGGKLSMNIEAK